MYKSVALNVPCQILVSRLRSYISLEDVCKYLEVPVERLQEISRVTPKNDFEPEAARDVQYHLQKLAYLLANPAKRDPIDVDCLVMNGKVLPFPVIQDGRHRYLAALLRGDKTIHATFSGSSDLFRYLTGASNARPHSPSLRDQHSDTVKTIRD